MTTNLRAIITTIYVGFFSVLQRSYLVKNANIFCNSRMAQKPGFLANMRAATRLLVATRFRGVGGHGNPKTWWLRDLLGTARLLVSCCASNLTVNFYTILVGRASCPSLY
jgi:hypothetical protein